MWLPGIAMAAGGGGCLCKGGDLCLWGHRQSRRSQGRGRHGTTYTYWRSRGGANDNLSIFKVNFHDNLVELLAKRACTMVPTPRGYGTDWGRVATEVDGVLPP